MPSRVQRREGQNGNVAARLTSFSADGRIPLWRVSWRDFTHAPILGDGAGTFWESWVRYRTIPSSSTQAHSLYLGTMGELGIVGLALLLLALVSPIIAGIRSRENGFVPITVSVYLAWAAHAGIDWDWALMGATVPALLCGIALVKQASFRPIRLGRAPRWGGTLLAAMLIVVAIPVLAADIRLRSAAREATVDPRAAISSARSVKGLVPWSSTPYLIMADAYGQLRDRAGVRMVLEQGTRRDGSSWLLWRLLANASTGSEREHAQERASELDPLGYAA